MSVHSYCTVAGGGDTVPPLEIRKLDRNTGALRRWKGGSPFDAGPDANMVELCDSAGVFGVADNLFASLFAALLPCVMCGFFMGRVHFLRALLAVDG